MCLCVRVCVFEVVRLWFVALRVRVCCVILSCCVSVLRCCFLCLCVFAWFCGFVFVWLWLCVIVFVWFGVCVFVCVVRLYVSCALVVLCVYVFV